MKLLEDPCCWRSNISLPQLYHHQIKRNSLYIYVHRESAKTTYTYEIVQQVQNQVPIGWFNIETHCQTISVKKNKNKLCLNQSNCNAYACMYNIHLYIYIYTHTVFFVRWRQWGNWIPNLFITYLGHRD